MLRTHLDTIEKKLIASARVTDSAGHSLHKGTPREALVSEFLSHHLSETVAIGSGEIIDIRSKPDEPRNQIDIVVYRRNYPKIDFGGGINAFLAESVVAAIEVKSVLKKSDLKQSIKSARNVKSLHRLWPLEGGDRFLDVLNFVVAYDGPARMQTVYKWIEDIHSSEGIAVPALPKSRARRVGVPSPSLDAVFVLGKGYVGFDNMPLSFLNDEILERQRDLKWTIVNSPSGNLFTLFVDLTFAVLAKGPDNLLAMMYYTTSSESGGAEISAGT